jgi:hypothetical protein
MSRTYQQKLDQLDDLRRFECLSEAEYRRLKQELLVTEGPPAIEKRPGFTGLGIATAHGTIRVEPTTAANCPHCGRIIEGIHLCTNYTAPEKGSLVALWDRELQAARKRIDEVWSSGDYIYRVGEYDEREPVASVDESDVAWSLWCTDPRVEAFVERVSDWPNPGGPTDCPCIEGEPCPKCDPHSERYERCLHLAWERDEGGWRTEAEKRAGEMMRVILDNEHAPEEDTDLQGPARDE